MASSHTSSSRRFSRRSSSATTAWYLACAILSLAFVCDYALANPVFVTAPKLFSSSHPVEQHFDPLVGRDLSRADASVAIVVEPRGMVTPTGYLRVAALSIALYDFLITLPAEWRLYRSQASFLKMRPACRLFICVRYLSVVALVVSAVGYFGHGFSAWSCARYQYFSPLFKFAAVVCSQIITGVRAYAISRRSLWVKWAIIVTFFLCFTVEVLGNLWMRKPQQTSDGNCTSGELEGYHLSWLHYLAVVVYDTVATIIATVCLFYYSSNSITAMPGLSRLMLKEGIAYFVALAGVNVFNLILYNKSAFPTQSGSAMLAMAVTMIMSERIILGPHNWVSGNGSYETGSDPQTNGHMTTTMVGGAGGEINILNIPSSVRSKSRTGSVQMMSPSRALSQLKIDIPTPATSPTRATMSYATSPAQSPTHAHSTHYNSWSSLPSPATQIYSLNSRASHEAFNTPQSYTHSRTHSRSQSRVVFPLPPPLQVTPPPPPPHQAHHSSHPQIRSQQHHHHPSPTRASSIFIPASPPNLNRSVQLPEPGGTVGTSVVERGSTSPERKGHTASPSLGQGLVSLFARAQPSPNTEPVIPPRLSSETHPRGIQVHVEEEVQIRMDSVEPFQLRSHPHIHDDDDLVWRGF